MGKKKPIGVSLDELLKRSLDGEDLNLKIKELELEIEKLYDEIKRLENENKKFKEELSARDSDSHLSVDELFRKGLFYDKKGDYPYAAYYYIRTLSLEPKHVKALINLGAIYYEFDIVDRAKEIFKKVLEIEPYNEIALENLKLLEEE